MLKITALLIPCNPDHIIKLLNTFPAQVKISGKRMVWIKNKRHKPM